MIAEMRPELGRQSLTVVRMKLVFAIAAAWTVFDLLAGKVILSVIAPIDMAIWQTIAQAFAH
jgi:hypothetical protein